jgi:cytochrome b6-f complex iron-sulfur subunit
MAKAGTKESRLPTVKRRDFLRTALGVGTLGSLGAFGAASLAFLWPQLGEGFGAVLDVGDAEEIRSQIESDRAPFEFTQGRMYVVTYNTGITGAEEQYGQEHEAIFDDGIGLMAIFQQCVHLGCRVPWCQTSQWFECPCHGSKYNRWAEWVEGPAPRGLDRFPSEIDEAGRLQVNTGVLLEGPPRTERVLAQDAEGPNCIDI